MTNVDEQRLRAMSSALEHRGPDDDGLHVDRDLGVGLAARRLSVIDLEGGHQPLANEDGTIWAVLNGEIYNHPALRRRLAAGGHALATSSDTEVLVHLYEDFGAELVHALEGMYAFAIWDARQRRLMLARDRFGEKPLFYRCDGAQLTFASELTALLCGLQGRPELDERAVDAFFTFGYVPGPQTVARGIVQLQPGSVLLWEDGKLATSSYWHPPVHADRLAGSDSQIVAELRAQLEDSIRGRLLADVPIGLFLSGGVDSTLVGAVARRLAGEGLKTFSVGYDTGRVDETAPARTAARAIGSDHYELVIGEADLAARAPTVLSRLDQPLGDPAFVALQALSEFAREHVKVAVGGEGADELFGGYPRYRWLARAGMVARAARCGERIDEAHRGRLRRLAGVAAGGDVFSAHLDWVSAVRPALRSRLYGPRLAELAVRNGRAAALRARVADSGDDLAGGLMRLDQLVWLTDDVLVKADRASMQASLELRTPFLGRELAELAAAIPASVHVSAGGKRFLREVLRLELPAAQHGRRKVAFRVPAAEWLRGPLAPRLAAQLEGPLYAGGWFDPAAAYTVVAEHAAGHDRSQVLWPLFALGSWLEGAGSAYA